MAAGYIIQADTDVGIIVLTHRQNGATTTWNRYTSNPARVLREAMAAGQLRNATSDVRAVFGVQRVDIKNQKPVQVTIHDYEQPLRPQ